MKVAVSGSSGLIGTALVAGLAAAGHEVVRLTRGRPSARDEVAWDPLAGTVDVAGLRGVEAVVHLAGAGVGDHRWTAAYKKQILDSRVLGTRTLVDALASMDQPPRTLVSGSAIGFYGSRGDEELTEDAARGEGFLADVVVAWEAEAARGGQAGLRVVTARSGLVLARKGGAFGRLLPLIRLGLGGPLGNGRQWWSWISLEDEVAALMFLLTADLSGPVNLTAPEPRRNGDVVRALARRLHRPAVLPAPALALKVAVGGFADDILASQKVVPRRLLDAGFAFTHADLEAAAEWATAG